MLKLGRVVVLAFAFCAAFALTVNAQDTKKDEGKKDTAVQKKKRPRATRVGAEPMEQSDTGEIVKLDKEKNTITVKDEDGKERVFTIDEHVKVMGPRGGKVASGMSDKRFHVGMPVNWKADKSGKLLELHFGIDRARRVAEPKEEASKAKDKEKEKKGQ